MEKERQTKILLIISLVVSVLCLSLGFAAFSTTLSISSSASVTPNDSSFSVLFSSSNTSQSSNAVIGSGTNGATSSATLINGTTIDGVNAYFSSPGQKVTYIFYAHNTGEYAAYLRNISFGSGKTCTADYGTTDSLVQAACEDISIGVNVGSTYTDRNMEISGHRLGVDQYEAVIITIDYAANGALADGNFSVYFDDITFTYSSADAEVELITFTIDSKTYSAEKNMTFSEWINSSYNTDGYTTSNLFYVSGGSTALSLSTTIGSGSSYSLTKTNGSSGGPGGFVNSPSSNPSPF